MSTKTFKIGECCKGGIITIEIKDKTISIIGKEWDHANGGRRTQQKNNPEWYRETVQSDDEGGYRAVRSALEYLTWSGIADKIMKHIETKIKFEPKYPWEYL